MKERSMYGGKHTITFSEEDHAYRNKMTGYYIPSVTTILKRSDKSALMGWAASRAAEHVLEELVPHASTEDEASIITTAGEVRKICKAAATAFRKKTKHAADVGKLVHRYSELRLLGESTADVLKGKRPTEEQKAQIQNGFKAFEDWFGLVKPDVIDLERIIYSDLWFYAGQTDIFARIKGALTVLDIKTSSGIYPEMKLQTAAYRVALEEEMGERIEQTGIVHLCKSTGQFTMKLWPRSKDDANAFLRLREYHEAMSHVEKNF